MYERLEAFQELVEQICYSFYRYEIKTGMIKLEILISQITDFISKSKVEGTQLEGINKLLQIILLAVEKKDFLIVADVLKYELLEQVLLIQQPTANGESI